MRGHVLAAATDMQSWTELARGRQCFVSLGQGQVDRGSFRTRRVVGVTTLLKGALTIIFEVSDCHCAPLDQREHDDCLSAAALLV